MVNKLCPNCGKSFTVSNQNKNQECCNNKCKTELNNKRKTKQCEYCHKDFVAKSLSKNRFCSRECSCESMKIHDDYNCKNCGKQVKYKSNQSNIYCSKKCYSEYTQAQNKLKPIVKPIKLSSLVYFNECIQCNKLFTSQRKNNQCCSDKCKNLRENKRQYIREYGTYKKQCRICNKEFNAYESKYTYCCSSECKSIYKKKYDYKQKKERKALGLVEKRTHIKRARKYNVEYESGISIEKIKQRDGNKCLICKKKVLKVNQSGYHKDNGTIGHIIAMCNGGNHTMQNVQLECAECNTKKGSNNMGQLRLF